MVIRYLINMLYIAHMTHMIDDIYIDKYIRLFDNLRCPGFLFSVKYKVIVLGI